jgi:hypothetical protein
MTIAANRNAADAKSQFHRFCYSRSAVEKAMDRAICCDRRSVIDKEERTTAPRHAKDDTRRVDERAHCDLAGESDDIQEQRRLNSAGNHPRPPRVLA